MGFFIEVVYPSEAAIIAAFASLMMRLIKRFAVLGLALLLAAIGFLAWLAWDASVALPLKLNAHGVVDFDVRPGLGLKAAAYEIERAGIGIKPWKFVLLGRLTGRDRSIQAGSYEVRPGITAWQLLEKLNSGDVMQSSIVLIEGKTFEEFRALIDAHPDLRHDTAGMSGKEILQLLGAPETQPEGLFFPDTYLFTRQTSDLAIYRRAYEEMRRHLASEWEKRDPSVPYRNVGEALIMASIIEKETGIEADRGKIASVFVNRLRRGMPLQSDPTVIYGLGKRFDGNLKKRDLETDTPWNTYTRSGLPPTPIAMPGLASIRAALNPPLTDYLYFVATGQGDGSSVFSATLKAHNRAVDQYQRGAK